MIVSFRCPPRLKERINALLDAQRYLDFSSFCVTALENQLLLEEMHAEASGAPGGTPSPVTMPTERQPRAKGRRGHKGPTLPRKATEGATVDSGRTNTGGPYSAENPLIDFDLAHVPERPPLQLPAAFPDMFRLDDAVPLERWLFGQYNRLLPAKASLRLLTTIASEGKEGLMLGTVAPKIAESATGLGDYLRSLDRRFDTHRDDLLATAFPESGPEGEKGRLRYSNQFVGHIVRGEQGGLLVGLKFAVIQVHKNKPYILPTTSGWEFARLHNPILDQPVAVVDNPPPKLGEEEVSFIIDHVRRHVPVELFAYRAMLSLIASGKATPESLNESLVQYLGQDRKPDNEQDFVATQRSGVIGRMTDLGLVTRERRSTRITYRLTSRGTQFLEEVATSSIPRSVVV